MKIKKLQKKIIINYAISTILLLICVGSFFFAKKNSENITKNIKKIKSEISKLDNKTREIQGKVNEIKKYQLSWKQISERKKDTSGIKMDNFNKITHQLTKKYSIADLTSKVAIPKTLEKGVFKRNTLKVSYTKVDLSFKTIDDTRALLFLDEFINSFPGFIIIERVSIVKKGDYESKDLIDISTGKKSFKIETTATIHWYATKKING